MSRLRLAAGCALLRLAQEACYHEIITLEQYQLCALVINVRLGCFFCLMFYPKYIFWMFYRNVSGEVHFSVRVLPEIGIHFML